MVSGGFDGIEGHTKGFVRQRGGFDFLYVYCVVGTKNLLSINGVFTVSGEERFAPTIYS